MTENIRTFLSVDIDDENLLSRIMQIQGKINLESAKMKLVERDNIHFTWHFFGDTHLSKIDTIHQELLQLEFEPIQIEASGVGAFPNIQRPRVIWVGVTQNIERLRELKMETDTILKKLESDGLMGNTVIIFSSDNGPDTNRKYHGRLQSVGETGEFRGRKRWILPII